MRSLLRENVSIIVLTGKTVNNDCFQYPYSIFVGEKLTTFLFRKCNICMDPLLIINVYINIDNVGKNQRSKFHNSSSDTHLYLRTARLTNGLKWLIARASYICKSVTYWLPLCCKLIRKIKKSSWQFLIERIYYLHQRAQFNENHCLNVATLAGLSVRK